MLFRSGINRAYDQFLEQNLRNSTSELNTQGPMVNYANRVFAGYLRYRPDRDLVVLLIGDHQPAAFVSGERASWDVPVHVITARSAVVQGLRKQGFHDGLAPGATVLTTLDGLLPRLLTAFSSGPALAAGVPAAAAQQ